MPPARLRAARVAASWSSAPRFATFATDVITFSKPPGSSPLSPCGEQHVYSDRERARQEPQRQGHR